jgi:hypothetical protein
MFAAGVEPMRDLTVGVLRHPRRKRALGDENDPHGHAEALEVAAVVVV